MVKLYTWSHCSDCWEFYAYFKTRKKAGKYITKRGFNPKYCRIEKK